MSTNVEQIKERLDIVEVLSTYMKVEKAGINFKAKCPFHNEKTPSFFISPSRQSFYCFGCGEKGDIFSFVEKFESLDFKGALKTLAERAGIELKNFTKEERPEERDKLFEIMEKTTKLYEKQLAENKTVSEYLKKRGLAASTISRWRLGFAKDEWRSLHDYLVKKGFTKENMLEAGLVKKVQNENKYYDTFRNRVVFPIFDGAGRVIAFSGRTLVNEDNLPAGEAGKTPKYLNSPETKLFYKSETLYGFNIAKNYIRKLDYTILVEGQMDLVMSHQAGVYNTVASSGTALTELHLKKIQRLSNRVVIAYDSDASGEKASRRAAEMAMSLGMETKIASLPKGEDPASVIQEEPEKWKKALRESEHFADYVLNKALSEKEGRNLNREILKNVLPVISLIKSDIEKSQFVKKIALKLKVREEDVWNDLKKIGKVEKQESASDIMHLKTGTAADKLERLMVGLIFGGESEKSKTTKNLRRFKEKWEEIAGENTVKEILDKYEKEKESLIFESERYIVAGDINKLFEDILRKIELESLKAKLQEAVILLDNKNISKEDEKEVKLNFNKIQKRIKELNY